MKKKRSRRSIYLRDRYDIKRLLGQGSMSRVYLATHKKLGRDVAIKIPRIESLHRTEIIEKRFLREAQAAMRLSHPNICPVYDFGLTGQSYYLSMKYITGQSLADVIRTNRRLDEIEAARIVAKVASGMADAHRHGILHRDLKTKNIMIADRGEPIILDFGLACFHDNSLPNQSLTNTGKTVGTPAYMSPEQALGERKLTPRSDIFSLGVILWEMLCGERPFQGQLMQLMEQLVTGPSPSPRTKRDDITYMMEAIVLKALANRPEYRFQSMEEFQAALETFIKQA